MSLSRATSRATWLAALAVAGIALAPHPPAGCAFAAGAGAAVATSDSTRFAAEPPAPSVPLPAPPVTAMRVVRDTLHGTVVVDPYRWLEDGDSPETRDWLARQDEYWKRVIAEAPGRERIQARLAALRRTDDATVPLTRAGRLFYLQRAADREQYSLVMREKSDGPERLLFDPTTDRRSPDGTVRILDVSSDGRLVAVGRQRAGEDEVVVAFLDVSTRKFRRDQLPRGRYLAVRFAGDARSVLYARADREGPRVRRHVLGADPARDPLMYGEGLGRDKLISLAISENGSWLLISVRHGSAGDKVELYVKDLRRDGGIVTLVNDLDARFEGRFGGDTLFVLTNWEAPKQRIFAVDLKSPGRSQWREIVKQGLYPIDGWTVAGGRLLLNYAINVVSQLYLLEADGRVAGPVPVGDLGAVRGMSGRWSEPDAYLTFESFNVPPRIQCVRTTTNDVSTWWASNTPFRGEDYLVEQAWFGSKDGKRVPMFIAMRKGTPRNGTAPAYLTGYGGFAQNRTPRFSNLAAMWMESGGIWVEPALRGGAEFGEEWHRGGMREQKQTTFDDFLAASDWLVNRRLTSRDRLAIAGGSNGGLLVGAALTQRPEQFRAVVCSVPLLDMLRYHRRLVAPYWVSEYGSSDDSTLFRVLREYSPYHHVRVGERYPAVMLVSGDADTRVDPMHARKMTAMLQSSTGSDRPVVLRYDARTGHSGGKPRSRQVEDDTDTLQFLFWQLGVEPRDGAPPPLPPERPASEHRP